MEKDLQEYLIELGYSVKEAEWYITNAYELGIAIEYKRKYYKRVSYTSMAEVDPSIGYDYIDTKNLGASVLVQLKQGYAYWKDTDNNGYIEALPLVQALMNNNPIPKGWSKSENKQR